jgi:hypothetical protein
VEVYVKNHLPMPAYSSTYTSSGHTRGLYFQAPTDFNIIGLRVPDEKYVGRQAVEVFRLKGAPPAYPATAKGGQIFYQASYASSLVIPTFLSIKSGEWIGILGGCGTAASLNSSYGASAPTSTIRGRSVKLFRFLTQNNIAAGGNNPYSGSTTGTIARIEVFTSGEGFGATAGGVPRLGTPWEIQLNGAYPSSALFNIGVTNSGLYPFDLGFLGVHGGMLYTDLTLLLPTLADTGGIARLAVNLPVNPFLVGSRLYAQGIQINTTAPGNLMLSDYLRVVTGN